MSFRGCIIALSLLFASAYPAQCLPACQNSIPSETADDPAPLDTENVRRVVDEVLSAPEYRHIARPKLEDDKNKEPGWLDRFFEWLFSGREVRVDSGAFSWAAFLLRGLAYLIALAIAGVICLVVARGIARRLPRNDPRLAMRAAAGLTPGSPPGELPSDEYVRRALEFAKSQDYRAAIRELLLGAMSWIERAGLIRFRRGLSNRDYLRAVWRRPNCRDSMTGIIDAFDRTYFGRRSATAEMFEQCLQYYRAGFVTNATSSMAN